MIIRRQSLPIGLVVGLFLLSLSVPVRAQDRDQIRSLASNLSNEAHETWFAMRNARDSMDFDDNPSAQRLYGSLRDFDSRTRQFAQESREWWEPTYRLRDQARRLVNEASRIDNLMIDANIPDSVRHEWFEADNSVQNLADAYNLPYERERGLARRDYDDDYEGR